MTNPSGDRRLFDSQDPGVEGSLQNALSLWALTWANFSKPL